MAIAQLQINLRRAQTMDFGRLPWSYQLAGGKGLVRTPPTATSARRSASEPGKNPSRNSAFQNRGGRCVAPKGRANGAQTQARRVGMAAYCYETLNPARDQGRPPRGIPAVTVRVSAIGAPVPTGSADPAGTDCRTGRSPARHPPSKTCRHCRAARNRTPCARPPSRHDGYTA